MLVAENSRALSLLASLCVWGLSASCGPSETETRSAREAAWRTHYSASTSALEQKRYAEAEEHLRAALQEIRESGAADPLRLRSLRSLAHLNLLQSRHARAGSLYQEVLAVQEQEFGPGNPVLAATLAELATVRAAQREFARAERLYLRALSLQEDDLDYQRFASTLSRLAETYRAQEKYAAADSVSRRAMGLKFHGWAHALFLEGRHPQAERSYRRALAIQEKGLGPRHPDVARTCSGLALLCDMEGRHAQAARHYQRALAIREHNLGPDHPELAPILGSLAAVMDKLGRDTEAAQARDRAHRIQGP